MNKSGYLLIETLMGLAILGLVSVTFLPIFTCAFNNFYLLEIKDQMKYCGETIMERIKSFDYLESSHEYILDMKLTDIMNLFYEQNSVNLSLPISEHCEYKYKVKLEKENIGDSLWSVDVIIISKGHPERLKNVVFKSLLPKPKK